MTHRKPAFAAALLAAAFSASGAMADITAAEAWESIGALGQSFGETITGTPTMAGNVITVRGVTITMDMPEAQLQGNIGDITLTERGDGTVAITIPPESRFTYSGGADGQRLFEAALTMAQSGMTTIVSRTGAETTYDFTADTLSFDMRDMDMATEDRPADFGLSLTLGGLAGQYLVGEGPLISFTSQISAENAALSLNGTDPASDTKVTLSARMQDLQGQSRATLPQDTPLSEDMGALLRAGFGTDGEFRYGATTYAQSLDGPDGPLQVIGSAAGGTLQVSMIGDHLSYSGTQSSTDLILLSAQLPVPEIGARIDESAFNLTMPVTPTEEPADFRLLTALNGIEIDEKVWALFDPDSLLPRTPANLVIDLSGKARWLIDILDPRAVESAEDLPAEIESLTINELEVSAAGAALTGRGAFTFDNAGRGPFSPLPVPQGNVSLRLSGADALMDALVGIGLVPEEQLMGYRMMLGIFATPLPGEDTLVSDIELTPDGGILANGQPLR